MPHFCAPITIRFGSARLGGRGSARGSSPGTAPASGFTGVEASSRSVMRVAKPLPAEPPPRGARGARRGSARAGGEGSPRRATPASSACRDPAPGTCSTPTPSARIAPSAPSASVITSVRCGSARRSRRARRRPPRQPDRRAIPTASTSARALGSLICWRPSRTAVCGRLARKVPQRRRKARQEPRLPAPESAGPVAPGPPAASSAEPAGGVHRAVGGAKLGQAGRDRAAPIGVEQSVELVIQASIGGSLDREPGARGRRPAGAGDLVVGIARHRHEQRRDAEGDQLVKGVVAGGGNGRVEGGEVAAHRIGGLQPDHPLGDLPQRGERRRQRRDLDAVVTGQPAQAARVGLGDLLALAEGDEHRGPARDQAQLGLGALARRAARRGRGARSGPPGGRGRGAPRSGPGPRPRPARRARARRRRRRRGRAGPGSSPASTAAAGTRPRHRRPAGRRAAPRRGGCRRRRRRPVRPRRSRRAGGRAGAATSGSRCPSAGVE